MMIRKMSLPRRTFLRGVGATVALPFLDAMVPALSAVAKIPQHAPRRLVVYGTANGVYGLDFFPKAAHGAKLVADALPRTLRPLAPVLDQTVIVEGTSNLQAVSGDVGSGAHARCAGAFLSGVRPRRTEGADVRSGISLDQYAAQGIGQDTSLASLEMAMESSYVGNCDQGYSCSYLNTFAWHSPTQPLPMENNPRVIFERLFGEAGPVSARLAEMRTERSILDWVSRDLAELQRGLGAADRTTVDEYLEAVRDVEQRIQRAEKHGLDVPGAGDRAVWDSGEVRRSRQTDGRSAVSGAAGRLDPRDHVPDVAGTERAPVPVHRGARVASLDVASRRRRAHDRAAVEDQRVFHAVDGAPGDEDARHAGRRRDAARSRDAAVERPDGVGRPAQPAQTCPSRWWAADAGCSRAAATSSMSSIRRS